MPLPDFTPLPTLLTDYAARFPDEAPTVDRFKSLLEEGGLDAFERSHFSPGHITGSAWIVDQPGHRTLLTHHAKLHRWLQLGGHCDGNPDVLASAIREAEEESGLTGFEIATPGVFDLDIHPIPARPAEPAHLHFDVRFALRYPSDQPFTISEESHDLAWVHVSGLSTVTQEPAMLRMADKWHLELTPEG